MNSTPSPVADEAVVERIFAEVDHQMDNYLPTKGESWAACRDRRLKAEFRAALQQVQTVDGLERRSFQGRVGEWVETCFPPTVVYDRLERRDRFVEEALELAQTLPEFTADRAHALVDYVFSRPTGVTEQEVGGSAVTLAALCHAEGIDQQHWAEVELTRISAPEIVEKIRAKQAAKPVGSALPMAIRQLDVRPETEG